MQDFEEQALLNPETTVTLAGISYNFKEPCKRDCSIWFGKGMKIAQKYGIAATETSQVSIGGFIESIPDVLDYIFDFLKVPLKERDRVNNEFEIENVMFVFNEIITRVSAPFLIGKTLEQPPEENPQEPTTD